MTDNFEQIVEILERDVIEAAAKGNYEFCRLFADAALCAVGGQLTTDNMSRLTTDQITLIAYVMLHEEVMQGGFIQLIHNGYGPFIFNNPFAKAMRLMGLHDFSNLLYDVRREYVINGEQLTTDCNDEEFMALYEQYPAYDEFDDEFVEHEPEYTEAVARYVDENIDNFAVVIK